MTKYDMNCSTILSLSILVVMISALSGCNFQQGVKDTGDAIGGAVDNLGNSSREIAKDVGDAGNEAVDKVKN
jgi:cobalamin synthase